MDVEFGTWLIMSALDPHCAMTILELMLEQRHNTVTLEITQSYFSGKTYFFSNRQTMQSSCVSPERSKPKPTVDCTVCYYYACVLIYVLSMFSMLGLFVCLFVSSVLSSL